MSEIALSAQLIMGMNKMSSTTKIHVLYSSPACYLDAINAGICH
jgi:hypothetical protein